MNIEELALDIAQQLGPPNAQTKIFNYLISHPRLIYNMAYYGALGAGALGAGYGINQLYRYTTRRARNRPTFKRKRRKGFSRKVKDIINKTAETKFIDGNINLNSPVTGTGVVIHITNVGLGDTEILRDGDKINIRSIQLRGSVTTDSAPSNDTGFRISLVRALDDIKGVLPTIAEIFSENTIHALKQRESRNRFKIYMDMRGLVKYQALNTIPSKALVDYYKMFKKDMFCWYDGAVPDITDAQSGHWFIVLQTDMGSTLQPTFFLNLRVTFKDV